MPKFTFTEMEIKGLYVVEPTVFGDGRGYFMETFNDEFLPYVRHIDGSPCGYVQDNESRSQKGVLRGLHMQVEHPQGKLVRVIDGEVLDVVVDVRKGSQTFGKYCGIVLSAENKKQLLVPEGFLHGYVVLSDSASFVYKCTRLYNPSDEFGVMWNDSDIGVDWHIDGMDVLLSEKDKHNHSFAELKQIMSLQ